MPSVGRGAPLMIATASSIVWLCEAMTPRAVAQDLITAGP